MSWLDGPCTTQLFGISCFWIARTAKSVQFLSGMVILVELIGRNRVEQYGKRLRALLTKLSESGWVQRQQQRRHKLIELIAIGFFPFAIVEILSRVGVNLPSWLTSIAVIVSSSAVGVLVVLQWLNILLMLVNGGTRMIVNVLNRRPLSELITILAFIALVLSFILELTVS